jgi:HAD superfamily hydrolase (TIGR01509 family)
MLRALIFDFDGTILDTELPTFQAWQRMYDAHGQVLSFEEYSAAIGSDYNAFDPRRTLEERCGKQLNWEQLDAQRRQGCLEIISAQSPLPGINRLLDEARELSLRCAIASSSPSEWVRGHLGRLGLLERFNFISCAENGCPTKPSPEVYLRALRGLGMSTAEALAIEDSPNGVLATQRAGIRCVVVPNELTSKMRFPEEVEIQGSLEEFSLRDYMETMRRKGGERSADAAFERPTKFPTKFPTKKRGRAR